MKILAAVLLLLAAPLAAQTIAPSQIKPGSEGQVLKTTSGKAAWGASTAGAAFPGTPGIVWNTSPTAARNAAFSDVVGLWTSCSTGWLKFDGSCSIPNVFNQLIKVDGTALTQRGIVNFINGSAGTVSCVDNPVTLATDCTVTGGSTSGVTWNINDVHGSSSVGFAKQNTSAWPMFVGGSLATTGSGTGSITVAQGPTSFSMTLIDWKNQNTATVSSGSAGFSAVIAPGYWYVVQVSGAVTSAIQNWTEMTGSGTGGGGGGSGPALQTNSTPNASQVLLNFTDANGFHFSNPSAGLEEVGADGTHYLPTATDQTSWNAKAPLASPTFTGTPAAPTAAPGTNTTQLATTAFVTAAVAGGGSFTPPTGTGFSHNTSGVPDPAARAVNVASADITGVQPTANGGTGEAGTFTGIRKANSASADTAAVAADFPTLNQNTTGSATKLTTPRAINGVNFDGSSAITISAAPSGSAGGAFAGSYPNPTIAGVGSTNHVVPTTDGAGNLQATDIQISGDTVTAGSSVSIDETNGGNGVGLENVTGRTPSIAGSSSMSGHYFGAATHGKYAFVAVAGNPATIITYDTSTRTPTVLSSYSVTGCNNAIDPTYDSNRTSTNGAGYLYFPCNGSNSLFILNVSSTGMLSAGTSIGGFTSPVVYGNPLDPVTHILYVSNFNLGTVTPVNLSTPLSPSLGSVITSTVGGINPNMSVVAPGNGYLYAASGTDAGHQSYAQVYTTTGALVSQVAIDHAPQGGPYMEGCYFFDAIHDASEMAIVNMCNVNSVSLVGYLPLANAPFSMLVANGFAYFGTDTVNDLIIADIRNPSSPFVTATVTGYGGVLGDAFNFAMAGTYLVGGTSTANATVYTDIGGTYTPQSFGDTAYYRRLQADAIVTDGFKNKGPVTGDLYAQWGGGTAQIPSSDSVCTFIAGVPANCPPSGGGLSGMTGGQVPIAATATTVTSSKALAGSGAGIVTGPTSATATDIPVYTSTSGGQVDSGVAIASLAPLASPTFTGTVRAPIEILSGNGAASTPALSFTGTWFSGGTATTTKPQLLVEQSTATSTGWGTLGTAIGANSTSSFTGNLIDLQNNGVSKFKADYIGNTFAVGSSTVGGTFISTGSGNNLFSGSLLVTGTVDGTAPVTVTTVSAVTLGGGTYKSGYTFNNEATTSAAVTYTLPTAVAGLQYCVANLPTETGVLTLQTSATGQFIGRAGAYGTTGGHAASAGALGDSACVVGIDSTHWLLYPQSGTWTNP